MYLYGIIYIFLACVLILGLLKIYIKVTTAWCKNNVCLLGKTVIVTGSSSGIGYETALECAKRGARLIMACKDELESITAFQNIRNLTQNTNIILKVIDLASLQSIRRFAFDILKTEERLDILINNAGVLGLGNYKTEDGLVMEMQINYFGPALLTLLLIDLLKKSAPSRIVSVSSVAAKYTTLNIEELHVHKDHTSTYAKSKLAIIFFTQELAKKLKTSNVSVFAVHPGTVATNIFIQHTSYLLKVIADCFQRNMVKSPEEGCQTTLYAALESGIEHLTGGLFSECKFQEHYQSARNPVLREKLFDETIKILKYYSYKPNDIKNKIF